METTASVYFLPFSSDVKNLTFTGVGDFRGFGNILDNVIIEGTVMIALKDGLAWIRSWGVPAMTS